MRAWSLEATLVEGRWRHRAVLRPCRTGWLRRESAMPQLSVVAATGHHQALVEELGLLALRQQVLQQQCRRVVEARCTCSHPH